MPKTVKAFLWLSALYVLFGAGLLAWNTWFPFPEPAIIVARIPAHVRAAIAEEQFEAALRAFALHTAIFVVLAGLAAVGRQGWARWLLLLYFLLTAFSSAILAAILVLQHPDLPLIREYHGAGRFIWHQFTMPWLAPWLSWPVFVGTAFKLALVILIFSPGAKTWFHRGEA